MKAIKKISALDAIHYEVHSHWLTGWISNRLLQDLMGSYFAWKVARKYKKYSNSVEERNKLIKGHYNKK